MGPLQQLVGMLPGAGSALRDVEIDDRQLARVEAIIRSMTPAERRDPKIINGSRKRRIATGSGTRPQDVNVSAQAVLRNTEDDEGVRRRQESHPRARYAGDGPQEEEVDMPVKIRLTRMGKKKQPSYRVVVMDSRKPRDGEYIEQIGRYDARQDPSLIEIDNERAVDWLQKGAQPTDRAKKLLEISGAWTEFKVARGEIHTVEDATAADSKPQVEAAPVMLDEIREEVEEVTKTSQLEEAVRASRRSTRLTTTPSRSNGRRRGRYRNGRSMNQGSIVEKVVTYVVTQIVDDPDSVQVEIVADGDDAIVAEVRTAKSDMGRVIGRRGRVARAIRSVASVAGDEEGVSVEVDFLD